MIKGNLSDPDIAMRIMSGQYAGMKAQVVSVNISAGGIPKAAVQGAPISLSGLKGDGHDHAKHNRPEQAVCLQDVEVLQQLRAEGFSVGAGTTGENVTVQGLNVNNLAIGTTLDFGSGLVLEITKVRNPCYVLDQLDERLQDSIRNRCGMYARVLQPGPVATGQMIRVAKAMPPTDVPIAQ